MTPSKINRELSLDFIGTAGVRILFIVLLCAVSPLIQFENLTHLRDGEGYLNLAYAFIRGNFAAVPPGDTQYFIGYPFFLSFFLRMFPEWLAVYLFQFLALGGIIVFSYRVFQTPVIARWILYAVPSCLLFTSTNMSEGLTLFLALAAVDTYCRQSYRICSFLLGAALLTRPQAAFFLYLVLMSEHYRGHKKNRNLRLFLMPLIWLAALHLFNHLIFGDWLHNYRLYQSHERSNSFLSIPLVGYWTSSWDSTIRITNRIYICFFTAAIATGLSLAWKRLQYDLKDAPKVILYWSTALFLFHLCLNSRWAFMELPRYFIPMLPAAFWGLEPYLPRRKGWLLLFAALSLALAVYAEASGNRYAH